MRLVQFLIGLVLVALLVAIYLAFLSRHKKSATGAVNLIGALGVVQIALNPEGAVLVNGELWQARAKDERLIDAHAAIRVVSLDGPIVIVERSAGSDRRSV
ncbi:MAG TPA: NfeD family protein [Pyrinomonadaceae bacterium]|nr:NfeD family protein [Pyrinomonadaceae bacterium]